MKKRNLVLLLVSALVLCSCGKTAKRADDKTTTKTDDSGGKLTIGKVDLNDPDLEEKWLRRLVPVTFIGYAFINAH